MGLNTGGTTGSTTVAPSNLAGQANQQGLFSTLQNQFAQPSTLYNLTPGERLFQGLGMGMSLPGATANRALGYVNPGSPAGDQFQNYFKNFIAPVVQNNAIASGYGGASGASMEALSRAGQTAAMQGLTSFGMPMAQADTANIGSGMGYAGLQRMTSINDLSRVQSLLQSLTGISPTQVGGGTSTTQTQGPGLSASLLNLLGSALLGGGGGMSLLGSLLGPLASLAGGGLASLFGGSGSGGSGSGLNLPSLTTPDLTFPNNISSFFNDAMPESTGSDIASIISQLGGEFAF